MKKIFKAAVPVFVLVAGLASCAMLQAAKPEPEKKDTTPRPVSLHVDTVRSETVVLSVKTQGEVRAQTEVDIVPEVSGRIVSISESFAEGGAFSPSTTLIKIDDTNYKLAVTRAEARVAEAYVTVEQELADASIKQKQWKDWNKDGKPTPLALNKPQVARAQANLRAAEADLEEAKINLERTNIRLPFNGRVTERTVGVGQFVTQGSRLGRVFATDVVEIRLPLTDLQMAELNLPVGFISGDDASAPKVTFSALLGNKQIEWVGHVDRTLASIDQQTRLVHAIAQVSNPYSFTDRPALAVGMFVSAEIDGIQEQPALVMPRTALRDADKVYVIDDGKLRIRTVNVLSTNMDNVFVTGGVSAGEDVVISAVRNAIEGMVVEAINTTTNVAANTSTSASR